MRRLILTTLMAGSGCLCTVGQTPDERLTAEKALLEMRRDMPDKRESQEICFIPDDDYRAFLRANVPDYKERVHAGEYVDANGKVLGHHEGYVNYTIGQRKGLGIALGHPAYITRIDAASNRITLGTNDDMYATELRFEPSSLRHDVMSSSGLTAKVRYRSQAVPVKKIDGNCIEFATPVWGITPGQSVVLYQDDLVVGGGIILGS